MAQTHDFEGIIGRLADLCWNLNLALAVKYNSWVLVEVKVNALGWVLLSFDLRSSRPYHAVFDPEGLLNDLDDKRAHAALMYRKCTASCSLFGLFVQDVLKSKRITMHMFGCTSLIVV